MRANGWATRAGNKVGTIHAHHRSAQLCSADLLTASVASATVVGCRLYDLTNGWGGHPGGEVLRPGRVHSCHHTEIVHS
jgi:hypothetical protein